MRVLKLILVNLLFLVPSVMAQVTISPTTLFFENNFSSVVVINNSPDAQDIQIEFVFGYPRSDEFGNVSMYFAEESEEKHKADISASIRAFPRALTLESGQRQIVRMSIRPDSDMADGAYWSRIKIISTPRQAEIGALGEAAVGAQLSFVFEQVLAVYFKKGNVSGGLTVNDIKTIEIDRGKAVVYNINMTGNAPFLGTINMRLFNASNQVVHEDRQVTSVFVNGYRNFVLPQDFPAGNYRVALSFEASRPDVPSQQNFPMATYNTEGRITVN
jgi:hypothetical protein